MENARKQFALFFFGLILLGMVPETTQNIPSSMWMMMKDRNITNVDTFLRTLVRKKPAQGRPAPGQPGNTVPMEDVLFTEEGTLINDAADEVSLLLEIERDDCEVKRVSHKIPPDPLDPNVIHWPECVKLDRCSGCCNNDMLECAPTRQQIVTFPVLRARYPYPGAHYFEFDGVMDMPFNRHLACECRCRVQPDHCVPGRHQYDTRACTCRCLNEHEANNCVPPHVWSHELCHCVCPPERRGCYDDEEYSHTTCSCVPMTGRRPPQDVNQGDLLCQQQMSCRPGFMAASVAGRCQCVVGSPQVQEGSLIGGQRPVQTQPHNLDRVPGHPQYVTHTTTAAPRPTRRPRATRRPRFGHARQRT